MAVNVVVSCVWVARSLNHEAAEEDEVNKVVAKRSEKMG